MCAAAGVGMKVGVVRGVDAGSDACAVKVTIAGGCAGACVGACACAGADASASESWGEGGGEPSRKARDTPPSGIYPTCDTPSPPTRDTPNNQDNHLAARSELGPQPAERRVPRFSADGITAPPEAFGLWVAHHN